MLRICSRSAETSEMESSSAAINILKPEEQSAQLACQLFFADCDLSGHGTACAGERSQPDYPRCNRSGSMIHSAVAAAAKSIASPARCLTSLSHALGLVP